MYEVLAHHHPDQVKLRLHLGLAAYQAGNSAVAVEHFKLALSVSPDDPEIHNNLGFAYQDLGDFDTAITCYRHALQLKADYPLALNNLGSALAHQGEFEAAISLYLRVLVLQPDHAQACFNLAAALHETNRIEEALTYYQRAAALQPDDLDTRFNMGVVLEDLGRLDAAIACYQQVLELDPDYPEGHCNLGNVLKDVGQLEAAIASYQRALELRPEYPQALNNLGAALIDVGQADRAIEHYQQALTHQQDYMQARDNLVFALNYSVTEKPATYLAQALAFGALALAKASPYERWNARPIPEKRLRLGFVSGDLRTHPVCFFLESVLTALDQRVVELHAYSTGKSADDLTRRIKPHFASWVDAHVLSDAALAARIHADAIDILIDLSGHTTLNRLSMFAWKPAPVQVTWLGYFASTGVPGMDYILGDPQVTPEEEKSHFSETVWRLPEVYYCYTPPDLAIEPSPLPALENGYVTFGCCNALAKLNDSVVALWSHVLARIPNSRLLLKTRLLDQPVFAQRLRERFAMHGIAADRLLLEGQSPRAQYFTALSKVDVLLDPFPYPGGTTSLDGLWMGVPVLTLRGERFIGHQGETILVNAGLSDWIAADPDEYVAKAVACSQDLKALASLRGQLRAQLLASPLCDAPRFARHFESALKGMWQKWCLEAGASCNDSRSVFQRLCEQGSDFCEAGHPELGLPLFEKAYALDPDHALITSYLGHALLLLDRHQEAEHFYRKVLARSPDSAEANFDLGNALKGLRRFEDAAASYRQALKLRADYPVAWCNLGVALREMGLSGEAASCFRRAIEAKADYHEAWNNLGIALGDLGQLPAALECYQRCIEFTPHYLDAMHNTLFAHNLIADQSPQTMLEGARKFAALVADRAKPYQRWFCQPVLDKRLRVGLVSGDLRTHPVGYFLESTLATLDRDRLELFAYSNNVQEDSLTQRIKPCFVAWINARGLSDEALARRMHDDGIDILIDLAGHTAHNRLSVFAWKPAPVQVTWLGYFATTGVPGMDYILGDPQVTPEDEAFHFSESIWRLPEIYYCFTPPNLTIEPARLPALSNGYVTFGCFNKLSKLNDAVVALWARILLQLPDSKLFLKTKELGEEEPARALRERFAAQGIEEERLIFEGQSPRVEYLAAYNRVDLALDPFPFPGGTTSVEGLWMGVPVVTLKGDRFIGHQGETILANAGLGDWIAADSDNYVAKAVAYAGALNELSELRGRLRSQLLASPLCDAPRFARNFEDALRAMWMKWCENRRLESCTHANHSYSAGTAPEAMP